MKNSIKVYEDLRARKEQVDKQANEAEGEIKAILIQLETEFGVNSLKKAQALLVETEKELEEQRAQLEKQLEDFQNEYAEYFKNIK